MRILIACEESDEVRGRFEKLGFDAWSCDLQPSRNKNNKKHIQDDLMEVLKQGWTCMIAFPPCTHLAVSGARHFKQKRKDGRQQEGIDFFMGVINADIKHIAVENPVGIMSSLYRKPDQIIQPYYFGDEAQKTTCLWLKNLPLLYHNDKPNLFDTEVTHSSRGEMISGIGRTGKKYSFSKWEYDAACNHKHRSKIRSKTFPGIAEAMSTQWGEYLRECE